MLWICEYSIANYYSIDCARNRNVKFKISRVIHEHYSDIMSAQLKILLKSIK